MTAQLNHCLDSGPLSRVEPVWISARYDEICDNSSGAPLRYTDDVTRPSFHENPETALGLDRWYAAQAISFCLSARLLCRIATAVSDKSASAAEIHQGAERLHLAKVDWFRINTERAGGVGHQTHTRLVAALHTLANLAAGLFSLELRAWRAATYGDRELTTVGLLPPPSAFTIPFTSFIDPRAVPGLTPAAFSNCHLPAMTHPDFFTADEWTGYRGFVGMANNASHTGSVFKDSFDGFGGDNDTIQMNGWDQPNDGNPFIIERVIRFSLVRWLDNNRFLLRSNYFQSQIHTHVLNMEVDRRTGIIEIRYSDHHELSMGIGKGVMTPFGIIDCVLPNRFWIWIWKRKWSIH